MIWRELDEPVPNDLGRERLRLFFLMRSNASRSIIDLFLCWPAIFDDVYFRHCVNFLSTLAWLRAHGRFGVRSHTRQTYLLPLVFTEKL